MTVRETSRHYERPRRPVALPFINAAWQMLGRWSQPRIDADRWFRRVRAPPSWDIRPFEALARSLSDEAGLTPVGRLLVTARVTASLRARASVEALDDPPHREIAPVVIVGLPRTGTTLLHRLLAEVDGFRALRTWEAMSPAPGPQERSSKARLKDAERAKALLHRIAPDYLAVHPMEPTQPEEEVLLFEHVGLSTSYEAMFRIPSYGTWLEDQDLTTAYEHLDRVLRHLEPTTDRRWLLKAPHHLEFLDILAETFPGLRLVWTHRDPARVIPSLCSMVAHGRAMSANVVDLPEIGRHWLRKASRMVATGLAFRKRRPEIPVLDVCYDSLAKDPISVVSSIVEFAGQTFGIRSKSAVRTRLARHGAHRYGRHVYEASDFGLEPRSLEQLRTAQ
ncbi:MAG: sulfotransferase [Myxococcota bacterium]